ncbi:MAG: FISUMP domain-containing protein [Bacteroidales bacterium]|nr:FISUMP domain-containing protein [Bacteroidales bacterium]
MRNLLLACALLILISCDDQSIPVARLTTYPAIGDSTILFELNASKSSVDKGYDVALKYRWDYEGDQIWDTDFSSEPIVVRYFPQPGTYAVSVEVLNRDGNTSVALDTIVVYGRNKDVSTLTDTRDGQIYRTVKLNGRWWMAESLNYGVVTDMWTHPMSNNNIAERYWVTDPYRNRSFSVYTWFEAMNYDINGIKGICPDGWHIPTKPEWQSLYVAYPQEFAVSYLGENGLSELNIQNGRAATIRFADSICSVSPGEASYMCSYHYADTAQAFYGTYLRYQTGLGLLFSHTEKSNLDGSGTYQFIHSVRCIKDSE